MQSSMEALSSPAPSFENIRAQGISLMSELYEEDKTVFADEEELQELEEEVLEDVRKPRLAKRHMIWWTFSEAETQWLFNQYRTNEEFRNAVQTHITKH